MKAFRFHKANAPLRLEEVPIPDVGPLDVLLDIKASGICGTDLHIVHGSWLPRKMPVTLGHEIAGVVEKVGENVSNVAVGDRVCVHYVLSCGECVHCSQGNDNRCRKRQSLGSHVDGGFAEYIVVPSRNIFNLSNIPLEQGAIIGCAVATPYHALHISGFNPGDSVAVFGLGGVGMHGVLLAKAFGASMIIGVDIVDFKLRLAKELGADVTINPSEEEPVKVIQDLTDGWGVDVALECAGTEKTMEDAIKSVCSQKSPYASGTVVSIAVQTKPIQIVGASTLREGALMKSGDHTRDELRRLIELVRNRKIDLSKSITHRVPFSELNKGIRILDEKKEDVLRVVAVQ